MITYSSFFVIVLLVTVPKHTNGNPLKQNNLNTHLQCGYAKCSETKPNTLNVHLIPHSHDDVGWLKTVDQYFTGARTLIQRADVNRIITSVVKALEENPQRRFIQVETSFFYKWWSLQDEQTQNVVRRLVNNGQLEFTGGGWSMNDEGAVHYHSITDQLSFGLRFLNETFGECGRPKVAWQIDPFGHSSEMASIFAQLGFDGLFFARLDWRDKTKRLHDQTAEMIWQGSESLGNESHIFTSVLYNHYNSPQGFCFDINCNDNPIITDNSSMEYNLEEKVVQFTNFVTEQAKRYKTNNILVTMGDDFNYQDALNNYRNLDKLIEGFQRIPQEYSGLGINVFYSTPACYLKAVNEAVNAEDIELPLEIHDFFPYASDPHTYWSGYFTSRPASKRSERKLHNLLQIHQQLAASLQYEHGNELFPIQNAVGIMQHHDAITGTEKQHVADDYARIMDFAFKDSTAKVSDRLSAALNKHPQSPIDLKLKQCILENVTICNESNSNEFSIVVYNPLSRKVRSAIRIPVNSTDFVIIGPNDNNIEYQVIPSLVTDVKYSSNYELTFTEDIPAMGVKVFHVKKVAKRTNSIQVDKSRKKVTINPATGLTETVLLNGIERNMLQQLLYYESAQGNNSKPENRASGAYIFRNKGPALNISQSCVDFVVYKGALFDEVQQEFSSWAKQAIRVYHESNHIEFDWYIGSIPIEDQQGKEVISRFSFGLDSSDVFYTDSNGREMIRRIRNYRSTYNYTNEEPIAGNYYPIGTQLTITDGIIRASLLNDRSQAGTSLQPGEMELMIHRRILYDDGFGVGEALNETENSQGLKVRGRHVLTLTKPAFQHLERQLADELANFPSIFLTNSFSFDELQSMINWEFKGLHKHIPNSLKILTLEPTPYVNKLLLRLENIYDSQIGSQISIDLKDLFSNFDIISATETYLGANMNKSEMQRLFWRTEFNKSSALHTKGSNGTVVLLNPMQIKTFIVEVNFNSVEKV